MALRVLLAVALAVLSGCGCALAAEAPPAYAVRDRSTAIIAGLPEGTRIHGPSLVRLPGWLPNSKRIFRVNKQGQKKYAKWHLYFAEHGGKSIYMAWAHTNRITRNTVWYPYKAAGETGPYTPVLHLDEARMAAIDTIFDVKEPDLGSPDVFVQRDTRQFVMYVHAAVACSQPTDGKAFQLAMQCTYVLTSDYGLSFASRKEEPALGASYMRVFSHAGRLYAMSRQGTLWRAPTAQPLSRNPAIPAYQTIWEVKYSAGGHPQLRQWVEANTDATGDPNHVGLAYVTPTLLEVTFNVKMSGTRKARFGRLTRAFLDISSDDWNDWSFLTQKDGSLLVQTLLDEQDLIDAGIAPDSAFVSSSDLFVWRSGKECFRYVTVAYGRSEIGEGQLAIFLLKSDNDAQCVENKHPVFDELVDGSARLMAPPAMPADMDDTL